MKFRILNALTAVGLLLMVTTLPAPLMTEAVRQPLVLLVLLLTALNLFLERWLRPQNGVTPGAQVRRVMGMTMIKMFAMLAIILAYLIAGYPDPQVFGVAAYLAYLVFTSILVAESMRHSSPPTDQG